MKTVNKYIPFVFLSLLLFSCIKKNPKVCWLKIDNWTLKKNPDALYPEGALTQNFNQVYVTVDGKSLGVYQVPAKIPISVTEGDHSVVLLAGIQVNGINSTKAAFPFVQPVKKTIYLKENDTVTIHPTTSYYKNIQFLIEDFESPSLKLETSEESSAKIIRESDPENLKWGNYYGAIHLSKIDSFIQFTTTFNQSLPKGGTKVFLEIDYKNINPILTSTISYGNGKYYDDPFIRLNKQTIGKAKWKHIYINLTENISTRFQAPKNEVEFTALLDEDLTSSYIYLDNIKIIYPAQ